VRESRTKLLEVEKAQNYGPRTCPRAEHLTGVTIPLLYALDRKPAIPFMCYAQLLCWSGGWFSGKKILFFVFLLLSEQNSH
jgi:hypothetical protein